MPQTIKPDARLYVLCTSEQVPYKDLHLYQGSHIIGEVREIASKKALALYSTPTSAGFVPPVTPEIAAYIIGEAMLIRCRYLGCLQFAHWSVDHA